MSWVGTGCPTSSSTNYTGNLCIENLGGNSTINFDVDFTVTGDFKITNNGTDSFIRIPTGTTLTVTGDFGDNGNNNATFIVDGDLIVGAGIYGKNSNSFGGTGYIEAASLNFQGAPTCISPANCTGLDWNIGTCQPSGSSFCQSVIILPVELLFFNVTPEAEEVVARWATATERNAQYFAVERSTDGVNFAEIGRLDAAGNSLEKRNYSFSDTNPMIGRTYYRLRQVDHDGTFELFDSRAVVFAGTKRLLITPNPWTSDGELSLYLNFNTDEAAHVTIVDVSGGAVYSGTFRGHSFRPRVTLKSGTYLARVTCGRETFLSRFAVL